MSQLSSGLAWLKHSQPLSNSKQHFAIFTGSKCAFFQGVVQGLTAESCSGLFPLLAAEDGHRMCMGSLYKPALIHASVHITKNIPNFSLLLSLTLYHYIM